MSPIAYGFLMVAPIVLANLIFDLSATTNIIVGVFATITSVAKLVSDICDWQRWHYEQHMVTRNKIDKIEEKLDGVSKWLN